MRLLIASDIHGAADWCERLLRAIDEQQPDRVVLLGDLLYHGPRNDLPGDYAPKRVISMLNSLADDVIAVRGNCDAEVDLGLLPFPVTEDAWIDADGLHIFVSHGHHLPETPPIPRFERGTVLLRGHTHVPRGETLDGLHFWNPGSLSLPKGGSRASYGLYEDGCFSVLDTDGNVVLRHRPDGNAIA